MLHSFIFDFSCCPTHLSLPTDSQSHTLSVFVFSVYCDNDEVSFRNIANSFSFFLMHQWSLSFSLNNKNLTSFACYRPIFTFCLGYIEAESSLLFILEGGLFLLIVSVIFTGFIVNATFFISWKPYYVLVQLACHMWSANLLDVELIQENQLGGFQRQKLLFFVPGWFITYFYLLPFVNNKQYGEG